MYFKYRDQVEFFMVYIREAHPTDGWQVRSNTREKILYSKATSLDQRADVAAEMCSALKIKLPPLVDKLDDRVNLAYSAWPDRLYLIDTDGKIYFKGRQGPSGFRAGELEAAIKRLLASPARTSGG